MFTVRLKTFQTNRWGKRVGKSHKRESQNNGEKADAHEIVLNDTRELDIL